MLKALSPEIFKFLFPNHCVVLFCRYRKIHDLIWKDDSHYLREILSNPIFDQYNITVHAEKLFHFKKTHFTDIASSEKLASCYRTTRQSEAFFLLAGAIS